MSRSGGDMRLLALAQTDPRQAIEEASIVLESSDSRELAEAHVALSIAHRLLGNAVAAVEHAQQGAGLARAANQPEVLFEALIARASAQTVAGDLEEASASLDQASEAAPDLRRTQGMIAFQRGFLSDVEGDARMADLHYSEAIGLLENHEDPTTLRKALQNRSQLRLASGDLAGAESDCVDALEIAQEQGDQVAISGISQTLGLVRSYEGDLPGALDQLERADRIFLELTGASVPQHVMRCEVLISAGLFEEAAKLSLEIADAAAQRGDHEHQGTALLVAARALAHSRDASAAHSAAKRAVEHLEGMGRRGEALTGRLIDAEARFAMVGPSLELLSEVEQLIGACHEHGLIGDSHSAKLLAGQIALEIEEVDVARAHLSEVARRRAGPFESRIASIVARCLLHSIDENRAAAARAARAGFDLLDQYQSSVGATELQMGMERHIQELGRIGLRIAIGGRKPRRALQWLERTRARGLRFPPVLPSSDSRTRALLTELRQIDRDLRRTGVGDRTTLERRRADAQDLIRRLDHTSKRAQESTAGFDIDELVAAVGAATLIMFGGVDDRMLGVEVSGGRVRWVGSSPAEPLSREVAHMRFALRRAARLRRPLRDNEFHRVDNDLFGAIDLGDGEVIIVPPPELMALPWAALPSLRGRALVVSPSAELWLRARRAPATRGRVAVAGGPDLELASDEVRRVASLYGDAIVREPGASVEDVKTAIDGASTAHIAAHASFEVQNPMFSSLRLGDGNLNVYDLQRLDRAPGIVVLSACDSGYTEARPGEELAGLTSALLSMGTKAIVASVGLVPDSEVTSDLMVELHKGIISGRSASESLATAQAKVSNDAIGSISAASFICVGN